MGLVAAIRAAGGVKALAKLLGVRTPNVSKYKRIPAKHVDTIAEKTGLDREILNDRSPALPTEEKS